MADPIDVAKSNVERVEGVIDYEDSLTLDLSDDEVERILGDRLTKSEAFWNQELQLESRRKDSEKYWLNTNLKESDLYDFQVPYKDNRIFIGVETLIPMLLSKPPQPVVSEAQDTDASRELADNLGQILLALYEDLYLKQKLMLVARHLLVGYRVAYMKYRWDMTQGKVGTDGERKGALAVDVLRPQRVVLDEAAHDKDDVPLIGEYLNCSLEELMIKFPNKKDDIYRTAMGGQRTPASKMLASQVGYIENWFTYFDKSGEKKEGVAWKFKQLVLDKMKNPNYNYEEYSQNQDGSTTYNNFFDRPKKPYVIFSYLNLGRFVIDDTSLLEQAAPLQDVLNKRGRQIVENADQASSGTVYNSDMISAETVAQLTGHPAEKALVKGDVRAAAARLPTSQLDPYVLKDKVDARDEIDNIFGTRDPIRDKSSNVKTLGQTVLSQRQDSSRLQTLATALEDGSDRLYKGMTQMIKVFWDQEQILKRVGEDSKTTFIAFDKNKVEDGVTIRVKSGSVLPEDDATKHAETIQLAPLLDPLSIAEGLGKHDPKEFAKRLFLFKAAPDQYYQLILGENPEGQVDDQAASEIGQINNGQPVDPQESPSKSHLAQHQAFITSPQFGQLPPQVQQMHIDHAKAEGQNAKNALSGQGGQPQQQKGNFLQNALRYLTGNAPQ